MPLNKEVRIVKNTQKTSGMQQQHENVSIDVQWTRFPKLKAKMTLDVFICH